MYYSDAKQDSFVANLFNFKKSGYYLDIGSAHARNNSNTFYFDSIGWKGICIEYDSNWSDSYSLRKNCLYLNSDATKIDYLKLLSDSNFPKAIDYLSLDIDELSLDMLKILPLKEFEFKVITIEHDHYLFGDKYRMPQRQILSSLGYLLVCADVYVEQPGFTREACSFEDWWILPNHFELSTYQKVSSTSSYPSQIITKFGSRDNWYR